MATKQLTGMQSAMRYLVPGWWFTFIIIIMSFFGLLAMSFSSGSNPIAFILLFLFYFILIIIGMLIWIFMIVDCAQRNFKDEGDKVVWILIIIFLGLIGSSIYFYVHGNKPR